MENRVCVEMVNAGEFLKMECCCGFFNPNIHAKKSVRNRKYHHNQYVNIHRCFAGWKGATCNVTSVLTETVVCLDTMLMAIEGELKISSLS